MIQDALAPIDTRWKPDIAGIDLADDSKPPTRVNEARTYWDSLLTE